MIFTSYTKDVKSTLELRHLQNGSLIMEFPLEIGSISSTSGKREHTEFFFKLSTFTNAGITYRIDLAKNDYTPVVSLATDTYLLQLSGLASFHVLNAMTDIPKINVKSQHLQHCS